MTNSSTPLMSAPGNDALSAVSSRNSSFHRYGAVNQTEDNTYVQLTRATSMRSERMHSLGLAPTRTDPDGFIPETETDTKSEIPLLLKSAVPLIVTFILQYSLTVASVYAVGNLGSDELAAVSLSNLLASISSYGIIQGISSSLSTLCPQAYGRKDYKAVGLQTMRCVCLLGLLYIPIFVLLYYGSYPLFSRIVTEEKAARLASLYLRRLVFGVPGFAIFEVTKQYLQAQGIFHASTYVLILCAPLNLFLNITLVRNPVIGMGFIGAPTAVVITNWLMAGCLVLYVVFVDGYQCWCGFTKEIFQHWGRLLSLAGPGVLMIEAEWLAFEIIAVASSRFGTVSLAAQSVVATTCVSMYQVPYAISVAASTRVAWYIGAAMKHAAVTATKAALVTAVFFGIFNAAVIITFRRQLASIFSKDDDVIELAAQVLFIGGLYQIADVVSCVCGGILRGQGRQYIGGWLNLICYYVVALPFSYLCGFVFHMGLPGLWFGMLAALSTVCVGALTAIYISNWDKIITQSVEDGVSDYEQLGETAVSSPSVRGRASVTSMIDHNLMTPMVSSDAGEILATH